LDNSKKSRPKVRRVAAKRAKRQDESDLKKLGQAKIKIEE